jgi:hypothetical protein
LVVKGFQEKGGIDYTNIFSLVVKMTTVRIVLSIVVAKNLHREPLDVKTTFLHGELEEDIKCFNHKDSQCKEMRVYCANREESLY